MTQSELDLPKVVVDYDAIAIDSFFDSPDSFLDWWTENSERTDPSPERHRQFSCSVLWLYEQSLEELKDLHHICMSEHLWVAEVDNSASWWITSCASLWINRWSWSWSETSLSDFAIHYNWGDVKARSFAKAGTPRGWCSQLLPTFESPIPRKATRGMKALC